MNIILLGAYLPALDPAGISRFAESERQGFLDVIPELRERGIWLDRDDEDLALRAEEIAEETEEVLYQTALFEMHVTDNSDVFDPSQISHPSVDTLGWAPAFLTPDGETVLLEDYTAPATLREFRVAFWIMQWEDARVLATPWGEIAIPDFQPVPERLWRLAPFEWLD